MVARKDSQTTTTDGAGTEFAKDIFGKGALGGGIGALLGVAALAVPGAEPLVWAGAIAAALVAHHEGNGSFMRRRPHSG